MDMTAAEAARALGVTRVATSRWAQEGRFPGARKDDVSDMWRIPSEDVEALRLEREAQSERTDGAD